MTDLILTSAGDTWINSTHTGRNYGSTNVVRVKSGTFFGLVRIHLPNIAGRTVLNATLYARPRFALAAQSLTATPATEGWSPGRVTYANRPAVDAAAAIVTAVPAAAAGELVEIADVTTHLQAVANGTDWHGWQLSTNSAADAQGFQSADSGELGWELHLSLSDDPDAPSNLRPDGGGAVSTSQPILAWDYVDPDDDGTGQAQSQVQVDTPAAGVEPDEVAPDYDSGWQVNVDPEWALAGLHTLVGVGPHYWRVRVQDADGNVSDWSDWAECASVALPALVVDSPTGAFGDPSPTILAHLASGTLTKWEGKITGLDRSDIRYRSGPQTGPIDWAIPMRNRDGKRVIRESGGWLYLRAYDDVDRTVAVGSPTYVEAWVSLTFDDDLALVAPTGLTVTQVAPGDPRHVWSVARTEAPVALVFQVDGDTVERVELADLTVNAGRYSWTDSGHVSGLRPHTLSVRAVDGAGRSEAPTLTEHVHTVEGLWFIPDADIDPIRLSGTAVSGFSRSDYKATYVTSTGDEVDVIYGTPPRVGTFEGGLSARDEDVWGQIDAIEALRVARDRRGHLVWGSQSEYVEARDPDVTSRDDILPGNLLHTARIGFHGVD